MVFCSSEARKYSHARSAAPRVQISLRLVFLAICFVYRMQTGEWAGQSVPARRGIPTKPCAMRVAAVSGARHVCGRRRLAALSRGRLWFTRTFCQPAQFLSLYPKMVALATCRVTAAYPIGAQHEVTEGKEYGKDHWWDRHLACAHYRVGVRQGQAERSRVGADVQRLRAGCAMARGPQARRDGDVLQRSRQ
ncbi:hypothetical protein BN2475_350030 [Paraburkholderia ribeironis]|uniref:Uncharacterized protein n=1 Tax=Paraburkholderia ribeironis TaxID=1247936 RepID=A0A1N7S4Q4_9BURK|nr:hypothetical protein BN2475_350030 [Paraburkholderia ribeironis]